MNLNGKVFNPGRLRTEVSFQTRSVTAGAGGFKVPGWTTVHTVLVEWRDLHGSEAWTADAEGVKAGATVVARYLSDVDETWAILKGGERFEVVSLDNIEQRDELLELKVKRLREG